MHYYYWQAEREAIDKALETDHIQYVHGDVGNFYVDEDAKKQVGIITPQMAKERTAPREAEGNVKKKKVEKIRGIRI